MTDLATITCAKCGAQTTIALGLGYSIACPECGRTIILGERSLELQEHCSSYELTSHPQDDASINLCARHSGACGLSVGPRIGDATTCDMCDALLDRIAYSLRHQAHAHLETDGDMRDLRRWRAIVNNLMTWLPEELAR